MTNAEHDLRGYRIVLGVSGGIAAYKAVHVCRQLVDAGAHVVPVMTGSAKHFIGETTLSALASEPVKTSMFSDPEGDIIPHTTLGQSADLVVVAPATARLIGSYAAGISQGLLTATLIATEAPVVVAPAMHTEMWEHAAVQANIATLRERGVTIVPPEEGRLAGGDLGKGRLASPETIVSAVAAQLGNGPLSGVNVTVTAGGTREAIDPVRFLGNNSTGKQGHAFAVEAAKLGANVTLISTASSAKDLAGGRINVVPVVSAVEMQEAVEAVNDTADVVVMTAAVADFRPAEVSDQKIKKADGVPTIELVPNPDILKGLGANRRDGQVLVGFAAETNNAVENARSKLESKNVDLIVVNNVAQPGAGFGHDTNEVSIVSAEGVVEVPMTTKSAVAAEVLASVKARIDANAASNPT